ncbi:LruC domain-containing protein [Cyclonatronum proteinivorum]|uniref:LruC domain-containing protein n=1 Tax=Cyclonatronum proteinivorum TaxID=1457365 RepID=A0A345UH89_9BACT|nr:LruC domain-containing protein [Cyclonatronum proteinivorum]AXI99840.1 LruC domain-containing protein [Cyclonatronum proteinivorum]
MKNLLYLIFVMLTGAALTACNSSAPGSDNDRDGFAGLNVPSGFTFSSTQEVELNITSRLANGQPVANVIYHVYDADPADEDEPGSRLGSFFLDSSGQLNTTITVPTRLESLFITTDFIGVESFAEVPIANRTASYVYQPAATQSMFRNVNEPAPFNSEQTMPEPLRLQDITFTPIGTWNSVGRPDYLTVPDELDMAFLDRIDAFLPGNQRVPRDKPELLDPNIPRDIVLTEDAHVWVTFIGTGAGYRNAMGYYYYTEDTKPQTPADIDTHYIIFPHAHFRDGALNAGDKVQLVGPLDGELDFQAFPAGTRIGFFLIADGWKPSSSELTSGRWIHYSDRNLNTHISDPTKREHLVVVYDAAEEKLVLGWEDISRQGSSDEDFNDVMFFTSWNPVQSVDMSEVPVLGNPEAPVRKIENFAPAEDRFGTLAFEDLWPSYGDYDMNDLVVDYQVKETANANNNVEEIEISLRIRATGAAFRNAFGISLDNVPASNIASVSGNRLTTGTIETLPNGLEAGHPNAVIIAFDDANYNLPGFANVLDPARAVPYDELTITVTFVNPVSRAQLGAAPYNPFTFRNNERKREIHLPGTKPTALADMSLFGTRDDGSKPDQGRWYQSRANMNWGINIPESVPYPRENVDMTNAMLRFADWAESGGDVYKNWYRDEPGFRDNSKLFVNPNTGNGNGED